METNDLMPEGKNKIKKYLNSKANKTFLIFIGIAIIVVLGLFFLGNGGNLFKGLMIQNVDENEDAPPGVELPEFSATIVSKIPADGAVGISKNAGSATVVFDEAALTLTPNQDATVKKQGGTTDLSTDAMTYTEATKTLTIPYKELEQGATYTITVPKATIKNDGEPLEADIVWSFSTSSVAGAAVPPCTENQLQDSDKKICKNNQLLECTPALELASTKSTDGTKECKSLKWQAIASQPKDDDNDNDCTENKTKDNDKKLCKDKDWITCTDAKEGQKSTDSKKECKDGKWTNIEATPPKEGGDIKITKNDVDPKGFNPLINETKISYEISAKAKMEIKILDHTGVTVVTLIDNKEVEKGDYYVWWNGTNKATEAGDVVPKGDYTYKIIAKDPTSGEMKDVKTGSITALYQTADGEEDFENVDSGKDVTTSTDSSGSTGSTGSSGQGNTNSESGTNAMATVSLQSAQSGVTAGTGMPVLIYLIFPLTGFLISKKFINK